MESCDGASVFTVDGMCDYCEASGKVQYLGDPLVIEFHPELEAPRKWYCQKCHKSRSEGKLKIPNLRWHKYPDEKPKESGVYLVREWETARDYEVQRILREGDIRQLDQIKSKLDQVKHDSTIVLGHGWRFLHLEIKKNGKYIWFYKPAQRRKNLEEQIAYWFDVSKIPKPPFA